MSIQCFAPCNKGFAHPIPNHLSCLSPTSPSADQVPEGSEQTGHCVREGERQESEKRLHFCQRQGLYT